MAHFTIFFSVTAKHDLTVYLLLLHLTPSKGENNPSTAQHHHEYAQVMVGNTSTSSLRTFWWGVVQFS